MKQYCDCKDCEEFMEYSNKTEAEYIEFVKNRYNTLFNCPECLNNYHVVEDNEYILPDNTRKLFICNQCGTRFFRDKIKNNRNANKYILILVLFLSVIVLIFSVSKYG